MATADVKNEQGETPNAADNPAPSTPEQPTDEKVVRFNQAMSTVRNYAMGSMAVGLIPLPLVDIAALTSVQLKMLHKLAGLYEIEFSKELVKSLVGALLGGVIPVTAATSLASMIKIVPVVGQASGAISMVAMGSAGTYAVGSVFIEHFESGGTFLTFEPEKVKEKFKTLFEEGKQAVTRKKKDESANPGTNPSTSPA
ncbi:MAG: GTPase [Candidatus Parabeggiatoa sp. nov. 2]|nr:MAG: hypothetical protein B6247_30485 [Beggiatoa sp. 4572_84]RKZ63802.1 MAG: GTPase [Gammaproteobacteria bacterium]